MGRKISRLRNVFLLLCFFAYFGFWWTYSLDKYPGLHGDEAWFGLEAHRINSDGVHSLLGMNSYTGILQSWLSSISFKFFGLGVSQLRLVGVVFNFLGLLIFALSLITKLRSKVLFFFLILSQSSLYLTSPRIAWEVNSFSLFFLSAIVASGLAIYRNGVNSSFLSLLIFFFANIMGTYNHVIFSNIAVSLFIAYLLWVMRSGKQIVLSSVVLLFFNCLNVIMTFLAMRFFMGSTMIFSNPYLIALLFLLLVLLETHVLKLVSGVRCRRLISSRFYPRIVSLILLALLIVCFLYYHGIAFWELLGNYKPLLHVYSVKISRTATLLFSIGGTIVFVYLLYLLFHDITKKYNNPFPFFVVTHLGLLSIYTVNSSFRYYLCTVVVVSLYLATKIERQSFVLFFTILLLGIGVNIVLFKAFSQDQACLKPVRFMIGSRQFETSAHFISVTPLLKSLEGNQIGQIYYLEDRYFLEQPILFYRLIYPWTDSPTKTAIIDYDYSSNKCGFMFRVEKTDSPLLNELRATEHSN